MCTAITFSTKDHYFGRNLDLEYAYDENLVITPRNYAFDFRHTKPLRKHYAMIGMAYVPSDYPLYYDATNEKGLSIAALNFPKEVYYQTFQDNKYNITPFEFIPWILGQCASLKDVRNLLEHTSLLCENYSHDLPLSPLHWFIADQNGSLVVEPRKSGLKVYENPVGVLTNNPPFPMQMFQLNQYMHLSNKQPENHFSEKLPFKKYSNGMGAIGLPGDWSSTSRFVKATFTKWNSYCGNSETESVNQFFHILSSVEHPRGTVLMPNGKYEITQYSSCCNIDKGIYYYKTYENSQITAVDMHKENLYGESLIIYPLITTPSILWLNH